MTVSRLAGAACVLALFGISVAAQQTPPASPPVPKPMPVPTSILPAPTKAAAAAAAKPEYTFPSGAGILWFYVKPAKTADFEAIAARIKAALLKSENPARKRQAASWLMYRSTETPKDAAIYMFFFDPALPSAEYEPVALLREAFPDEVQTLYDTLQNCLIKIERMGLEKMK